MVETQVMKWQTPAKSCNRFWLVDSGEKKTKYRSKHGRHVDNQSPWLSWCWSCQECNKMHRQTLFKSILVWLKADTCSFLRYMYIKYLQLLLNIYWSSIFVYNFQFEFLGFLNRLAFFLLSHFLQQILRLFGLVKSIWNPLPSHRPVNTPWCHPRGAHRWILQRCRSSWSWWLEENRSTWWITIYENQPWFSYRICDFVYSKTLKDVLFVTVVLFTKQMFAKLWFWWFVT